MSELFPCPNKRQVEKRRCTSDKHYAISHNLIQHQTILYPYNIKVLFFKNSNDETPHQGALQSSKKLVMEFLKPLESPIGTPVSRNFRKAHYWLCINTCSSLLAYWLDIISADWSMGWTLSSAQLGPLKLRTTSFIPLWNVHPPQLDTSLSGNAVMAALAQASSGLSTGTFVSIL